MDTLASLQAQNNVDMGLVGDRKNLQKISQLGRGDTASQAQALKQAAQQFEMLLNQYWVNAMRQSNDTINPDSPLHSKYSGFFEDMLAQENVATMTKQSGLNKNSMTYLIAKQFAKSLGDDGKKLMEELGAKSVSLSSKESYMSGSNIKSMSFSSISKKDASVTALHKMYKDLPSPDAMKNFESEEDFVEKMMPYAVKAAQSIGFNPLILVAQAALETGWGKHIGADNNYYGIKASRGWKGESESLSSAEFVNGKFVNEVSAFRKYSDVLDSMTDYIDFIHSNPRYKNAVDKSFSPDEYFEEIQRAGYATDPNYASKLKNISRKIAFMAYK